MTPPQTLPRPSAQQPTMSKKVVSPTVQKGYCSWSGGEQHGTRMASGEIFNMNQLVAAHKTLPFGSVVKVTNLYNGKSATVTIKDRGPFIRGRIIDVSYAAAKKLDMVDAGVVSAQIELVSSDGVTQQPDDIVVRVKEKAKVLYDELIAKFITPKNGN